MPEELNAEVAEVLEVGTLEEIDGARTRWREPVEIAEAVLLAIVAVATAWSGYQAARWDGRQAELYGHASTIRIEADEATTLGGQQRLLDVMTFNTWVEAHAQGQADLEALYQRRFSPAFKKAFDAWILAGGLTNPNAPPGPSFMPEYQNFLLERGHFLNERANQVFEAGTVARETSDDYIRTTVVLATVLFLLALSQRFRLPKVRVGVLVLAAGLMAYGLIAIISFPRY